MKAKFKKGLLLSIAVLLTGMLGCTTKINSNSTDYSSCNITSNGKMAETEDGYFLVLGQKLYYADKNNLGQWIVVCNQPACTHEGLECKGALNEIAATKIWQKDGKLYEMGFVPGRKAYVCEIMTDGSGLKNVYEILFETNPTGGGKATFQDQFVIRYTYLDEKGLVQERIFSLEEDEDGNINYTKLYADTVENASLLMSGNEYWNIRGENIIISSLYLEEGKNAFNNLCRIENGKIEPLDLPEDISFKYGYLKNESFKYYQPDEGFYQYDMETGEKELLFANQLENGQGYVLSEDYMIECNRHGTYVPKEAYLKVYNGEEWLDIDIPEEVATCDDLFSPICIASDRIFFKRNVIEKENTVATATHIYYMMLNEEQPELILAGKIGKEIEVVEESSSQEMDVEETGVFANFEEVVVFDTEDYIVKVTDVYLDKKNQCCVEMYFENRSEEYEYSLYVNQWSINGIQCNTDWGIGETGGTKTICLTSEYVDSSRLSEFYNPEEYTDIQIGCLVRDIYTEEAEIGVKNIHIYPQGKENAITFTREPQNTDLILVDNENVSVIVTGYGKQLVPGDTIQVLIKNKTEDYIRVNVGEASANGIDMEPIPRYGMYDTYVNPGAVGMYPMTLFDGVSPEGPYMPGPDSTFFDTNQITSVEEIQMKLKITEYLFLERTYGEDFVNDTFILNPHN